MKVGCKNYNIFQYKKAITDNLFMLDPFEKFSNNYKQALKTAADFALALNHKMIEPDHILYGLVNQKGSVGAELLASLKIRPEDIKNNLAQLNQTKEQAAAKTSPKFSEAAKAVIQKSIQIAYRHEHNFVGTEHLLSALLQINNPEIEKTFQILRVSEKNLIQQVMATLRSASKLPDIAESFRVINQRHNRENEDDSEGEFYANPNIMRQYSALELFGNNLTSQKFQKKIDPVIGREDEISRIIQILSRRTKNNPILLGEPGVGKTAIIEGLAKKIINGEVPEALQNKKIYALDLTATVAGTMYRGEFENRVKQIIDEAKSRPEVILFIDEIHNIVGAGSASGSMDAANILKPALAGGDIRCIGATTYHDYRRTIENDPALERRFQVVKIAEPTAEDAKNILNGIKKYFENFHRVKISDQAIEAAINLSQRYLPEKFLPDKAIDLIDEAAAAIKVNRKPSAAEQEIKKITQQIQDLAKKKEEAISADNFELALKLKEDLWQLEEKILPVQEKQRVAKRLDIGEITDRDIATVIAKITGIPAAELITSEKKKIMALDKKLKQKIIGQDRAVEIIADFVKRSKAGLTASHRPLASFIFVGPSGVGKTYLAKMLAETLFKDDKSLIRIDMSEYSEKFNISKLIGAPAGYVGYKESGQLTEKIKHKPYAIVLFDEIEKANRDVFDLLLQVLDEGFLTDAAGARINFQNTIIIMTANIGSQHFQPDKKFGFGSAGSRNDKNYQALEEKIINETKNYFKVEFLNRVDKIIYFNPLSLADLEKIVKLELEKLNEKLADKNIKLNFTPRLIKFIADKSDGPTEGARGVRRTIQELLETPLAQKLLADEIMAGDNMRITVKNGIINIKKS